MLQYLHTPIYLSVCRVTCPCQSVSLARALFIFSFHLLYQAHDLLVAFHELPAAHSKSLFLGLDHVGKVFLRHALHLQSIRW